MNYLSFVLILTTLHLHLQPIQSLPTTALKNRQQQQQVAQMIDWNDIIKLDFSPNGIKKQLNVDMGVFAVRSKQTLSFGKEMEEVEDEVRRKKRMVNAVPEAVPCYAGMGGGGMGGGTVDYDDAVGRRRSQKKGKVLTNAKSMLSKLKKKKKNLVSEGNSEISRRRRRRRDVQDITDKAGEFMEKAKNSFMSFFNKVRQFSEKVIDRIKS